MLGGKELFLFNKFFSAVLIVIKETVEVRIFNRSRNLRHGRGVGIEINLTRTGSCRTRRGSLKRRKSGSHGVIGNLLRHTAANLQTRSLTDRLRKLIGGLVTIIRVLGKTSKNNFIKLRGYAQRAKGTRCGGSLGKMLCRQVNVSFRIEGGTSSNHFIQHTCCRIKVASRVDFFTTDLLGRHVACATHHHVGLCQSLASLFNSSGDAEVHHLNLTRLPLRGVFLGSGKHHNIRGLNIAVDNTHRMTVFQSAQKLLCVPHRITHGNVPARRQDAAQRPAINVFHNDVRDLSLVIVGGIINTVSAVGI